MNYYKKLRLDELGINSDEEAVELEFELDLRFESFMPAHRDIWQKQNAYLEHYSTTAAVTCSAREAGVTVYTAQRWETDNVLGFNRRLDVAALTFNDMLQQKALARASEPNAPAILLIELLRANMPEKYSPNDRKSDEFQADDTLMDLRETAERQKEATRSRLLEIARGVDASPSEYDRHPAPSHYPTQATSSAHYPSDDRADAPAQDDDALDPHADDVGGPPQPNLTRAQRRAQLRQQRKEQKKEDTLTVTRF